MLAITISINVIHQVSIGDYFHKLQVKQYSHLTSYSYISFTDIKTLQLKNQGTPKLYVYSCMSKS